MEELKNGSQYDFTKKLQQKTNAAFIKIIKITQNWKVIGYFNNQTTMEKAAESSIEEKDISKIWMVRNAKTIYKSGKRNVENEINKKDKKESKVKKMSKEGTIQPLTFTLREDNVPSPQTPLKRIYMGLSNMVTRKGRQIGCIITNDDGSPRKDEDVVKTIQRWRWREKQQRDTDSEKSDNKIGLASLGNLEAAPLKRDNVTPDEVVKIIKDMRAEQKIKCTPYQASNNKLSRKNWRNCNQFFWKKIMRWNGKGSMERLYNG
ncbi:hypothetical protein RhiirB3_410974 [Rhizophagus irregularis]|nr:hypothetical protein RhiirB3_410974 [Rhizophagus irregularis]